MDRDRDYAALLREVGPQLWRAIFAYSGGRREVADDAVGEAFARAIESDGHAISPDERSWASGATWSPDGPWIAYVDGSVRIVVMRVDGSNRRTLSVSPGEDEIIKPSWGSAARSREPLGSAGEILSSPAPRH
jgi:Tol biopolymer transport system component